MRLLILAMVLIIAFSALGTAQTGTFTYQGRLTDGTVPANGTYEMQFSLHTAASGGSQIGTTISNNSVNVTNGAFTVNLNFSAATPFATGADRFLGLAVRKQTDPPGYTTLTPRQQITSSPFAIRSALANSADALSAVCVLCITDAQVAAIDGSKITGTVANAASSAVAANAGNATNLGGVPASGYLQTAGGTVTGNLTVNGTISGNGSGLTNVPIRPFPWQSTANDLTAQANQGYIAISDGPPVVITLPLSLSTGAIIRVSGEGAGGWRIAQNVGQSIRSDYPDYSKAWIPRDTDRAWTAAASSANGTRLVAIVDGGQIYTSGDAGETWTARETNRAWRSVASSASGTKLVAVALPGFIYTSDNSGVTWTARDSLRNWHTVASSADGTKLVAAEINGRIYTSANSGASWTPRDAARSWVAVASSGDGTKLVAAVRGGRLYTSTDSGVSWTQRSFAGDYSSVASSADGSKLVAALNPGLLQTSTDSGVTWTLVGTNRNWTSVTSSADGSKLAAAVSPGPIFTSTDSGFTWTARETLRSWTGVASSADGNGLVAVVSVGQIYTLAAGTTYGVAGYIAGTMSSAVELLYLGGGQFVWLSHEGQIAAF